MILDFEIEDNTELSKKFLMIYLFINQIVCLLSTGVSNVEKGSWIEQSEQML